MTQDPFEALSLLFQDAMQSPTGFSGADAGKILAAYQDALEPIAQLSGSMPPPFSAWAQTWTSYQSGLTELWLTAGQIGAQGGAPGGGAADPRFQAESWKEGIFPLLHQSYSLAAKAMAEFADGAGLPEPVQGQHSFFTRLAADSLAPSNFALTNPEVLKRAQETGGQSLADGFQNLLGDIQKGYISTTDETAFEVGGNLGATPGTVVFRNGLIEVIQYDPMTDKVRGNPVLIVPPCVNKFYVFDLNERKSMVRHLLEQGHSVFMISWRNPGPDDGGNGWDEYIRDGVFAALEVTAEVSGSDNTDLLGWCNGGTMLIAALAVMPDHLKALTGTASFLSSMICFEDPGEVKVFLDPAQTAAYGMQLKTRKLASGRDIAHAMALLHVNESVWNFVVSNYLLGKSPASFDVLYWNADTSNLPANWYAYYIEEMYVANRLKQPGALTLLGRPVDTRNIDVPCYFVAATDDHIVPWKASFAAPSLITGPSTFVLTTGGHVSGTVINHPARNRKKFWTGGQDAQDADSWRETAAVTDGSWWPHWLQWLRDTNPAEDRARPAVPGTDKHKAICAAPGTYVLERA